MEVRLAKVGVAVQVVNAPGREGAGPSNDAVDLIALREQELRQVRAILTGDAGD
jgi:hypothetical protein